MIFWWVLTPNTGDKITFYCHPNSCSVVFVVTLTCLFMLYPFLSHTLHFYTWLRCSLEVRHCQDPSHISMNFIFTSVTNLPNTHPVQFPHINFISCQQWKSHHWLHQAADDTTSSAPKSVLLLAPLSPHNSHFSAATLKNWLWHLFSFCWPLNIHLMSDNWFPPFKT